MYLCIVNILAKFYVFCFVDVSCLLCKPIDRSSSLGGKLVTRQNIRFQFRAVGMQYFTGSRHSVIAAPYFVASSRSPRIALSIDANSLSRSTKSPQLDPKSPTLLTSSMSATIDQLRFSDTSAKKTKIKHTVMLFDALIMAK